MKGSPAKGHPPSSRQGNVADSLNTDTRRQKGQVDLGKADPREDVGRQIAIKGKTDAQVEQDQAEGKKKALSDSRSSRRVGFTA